VIRSVLLSCDVDSRARLRHLENERLELIRKAADMQSKAVRYKMLAAKADDSAADAAHLLHKDVLNLQQQAGMAPQRR
jgi:hypothetical protein